VIFDGSTAIMNGEVVTASAEGSTVMIDGEEVSVTFDGDNVIVNVKAVSEAVPAAAVSNGEAVVASASESAGLEETVGEVFTAEVLSEAIFPASVELNGAPVGVTFDGTVALVKTDSTAPGATVNPSCRISSDKTVYELEVLKHN